MTIDYDYIHGRKEKKSFFSKNFSAKHLHGK
jgi:hypothetical protein